MVTLKTKADETQKVEKKTTKRKTPSKLLRLQGISSGSTAAQAQGEDEPGLGPGSCGPGASPCILFSPLGTGSHHRLETPWWAWGPDGDRVCCSKGSFRVASGTLPRELNTSQLRCSKTR